MNRVLDSAVTDLRALFSGHVPLRTLRDVLTAEISPFVLEVGVLVELLLRRQIPLLLIGLVVEHARIITSGGCGPSHLSVWILSALVQDSGLYQLPLTLIFGHLDRHVRNLRLLSLLGLFMLKSVISWLDSHLVDHVSRREGPVRVRAEHARR